MKIFTAPSYMIDMRHAYIISNDLLMVAFNFSLTTKQMFDIFIIHFFPNILLFTQQYANVSVFIILNYFDENYINNSVSSNL